MEIFQNPFRPGAGQKPPYLAGRNAEQKEFVKLLSQTTVLENLIITGLRGVGKTSLLDSLQPIAISNNWIWAGTDLSESASLSERNLSTRVITDLSSITSAFTVTEIVINKVGFTNQKDNITVSANYNFLNQVYNDTNGLESDKLKAVLETIWMIVKDKVKGIVLAYDEAQILKDQAQDKQFPLSLLLEVTQYLQKKGIPYLLVLTGLPTLFPNLVDTRTYAERMFHILHLDKLNNEESTEAILKPTLSDNCPVTFTDDAIQQIISYSGGYPYFIQFLCKETFDSYIFQIQLEIKEPKIGLDDVIRKLDTDFYAGRWARITDSQRAMMMIISNLPNAEYEFTVQDITEKSKEISKKPMSSSSINQHLNKLADCGLIYKFRHGKYSFAVPMLSGFINRQT
jgi:DNA-binding transcriptional ArsR family regulator